MAASSTTGGLLNSCSNMAAELMRAFGVASGAAA
jgi:hypothetical protein